MRVSTLVACLAASAAVALPLQAPDVVPFDVGLSARIGERVSFDFVSAPAEVAGEDDWNALLTRFDPDHWLTVRGWTDVQQPWIETQWRQPAVRFFVRRDSLLAEWAEGLEPYECWRVSGTPRAFLAGEVWVEAHAADALPETIGEGTILHASRAVRAMEGANHAAAEADLERALAAPLPERARQALEGLLAECRARAERGQVNGPR